MPEYKYACLNCKREVNTRHSIKDKLDKCPHCGGQLERCVCFNGHVNFVGNGFYHNDYWKKEQFYKD